MNTRSVFGFACALSAMAALPSHAGWVADCGFKLPDFTVYSVEAPTLESSDILGLTGSEGSIHARHFAFVRRYETQNENLARSHACNRLAVLSGGRLKDGAPVSLSVTAQTRPAPLPQLGDSAPLGPRLGLRGERATDLAPLTESLAQASAHLLNLAARGPGQTSTLFRARGAAGLEAFTIDGETLARSARWTFVGTKNSLFLITVRGTRPLSLRAGVELVSAAGETLPQPGNLVLHFPDAERIEWNQGGASPEVLGYNVGYPFVVLAPRAHVAATELLITGAIYARRFTGAWDFQAMRPDFTRHVPTAQVNGVRPHELFGIGVSLKPPATGR